MPKKSKTKGTPYTGKTRKVRVSTRCVIPSGEYVRSVQKLFDLRPRSSHGKTIIAELPVLPETGIGLIVGPSGSGKTMIARKAYPDAIWCQGDFSHVPHISDMHTSMDDERPVVEWLEAGDVETATRLLGAVGLHSVPAWLRPLSQISTGERFRATVARALSPCLRKTAGDAKKTTRGKTTRPQGSDKTPRRKEAKNAGSLDPLDSLTLETSLSSCPLAPCRLSPTVVVDEFCSVVDVDTMRSVSTCLGKALRGGLVTGRFVGLTCRPAVGMYLCPDWVLHLPEGRLEGDGHRSAPRPRLTLRKTSRREWGRFREHHYLCGSLSPYASCWMGLVHGEPVAFVAVLPTSGRGQSHKRRVSRLVVLPAFQGRGIARRLMYLLGKRYERDGLRLTITTSHPAMIASLARGNHWRPANVLHAGKKQAGFERRGLRRQAIKNGRHVTTFEWYRPGEVAERVA